LSYWHDGVVSSWAEISLTVFDAVFKRVLAFTVSTLWLLGTVILLSESRSDLGERWPSRLVATAAADCSSKEPLGTPLSGLSFVVEGPQ
jgi:hypothetical protein